MDAIVVIAASAGGLGPIRRIVDALPTPCSATIFITIHIGSYVCMLPLILSWSSRLPVENGADGAAIQKGHIYVAPPDHHMVLQGGHIRLSQGPKVHYTRPAADPLFQSAAEIYGGRVIGIVLSGDGGDGAIGLRAIRARGGTTLVQQPSEAGNSSMPLSALSADETDACLTIEEIASFVGSICGTQSHLVRLEDAQQALLVKTSG